MITRDQLTEYFFKKGIKPSSQKNTAEYQEVMVLTSFLDIIFNKISFRHRLWHIANVDSIPNCPICGRYLPFDDRRNAYKITCSPDCERAYKKSAVARKKFDDAIISKYGSADAYYGHITAQAKQTSIEKYGAEYYQQSEQYQRVKDAVQDKIRQTNLERYGVDSYSQTDEFLEKSIATCLERYGVDNVGKSKEIRQKRDDAIKEKYGVDNFAQSPEYIKKRKETSLKKYNKDDFTQADFYKDKRSKTMMELFGNEEYFKTADFKEKSAATSLEKYGVPKPSMADIFKVKIEEAHIARYGVKRASMLKEVKQKIKETNLERYGVESTLQVKEFREKAKQTNIEKYGVDNYVKSNESVRKDIESFKEKLLQDGYIEEGFEIINYHKNSVYEMKCPHCKQNFLINRMNIYPLRAEKKYSICTNCFPIARQFSGAEKDLLDFVYSIYSGEIIENTKSIISPYEIDIFLPELNLAIEYNGLYWHSEAEKPRDYHSMKSNLCKEKGIHLIHIFEDDWLFKQDIVKSVLSNFVGSNDQQIIYARKCEIKEVNHLDTQNFLEQNHLLGRSAPAIHSIGLYFDNELISLMAFQFLSKEKNVVELSRYAIKTNTNIKGGAERIFNHFLKTYGDRYAKCVTFNDNGVFKGTVHYRLGFQYVRDNPPNFMYYDKMLGKRISKQSLRKQRLSYKNEEQQFKDENRYYKVYNAGNNVCEFILNKEIAE